MGIAVWEFMWCIDKITKIDDAGTGWVLGGKPITLAEIDMGHPNKTSEHLAKLRKEGYITTKRTPHGIIIKVINAKKRFTKNGESPKQVIHLNRLSDTPFSVSESPKAVIVESDKVRQDRTIQNTLASETERALQNNPKKKMDYEACDEDGNPVTRNKSGWAKKPEGEKKEGKNKIALRLRRAFSDMCHEKLKTRPIETDVGYKMLCKALSNGLTEEHLLKLFALWFKAGYPKDEAIQITRAVSAVELNKFKANNKLK